MAMRRWQHGLVIALAALVVGVAACRTPTTPDASAATMIQVAEQGSAAAPAGATNPPTIRLEGRTLVVVGLMDTPTPCFSISADATVSGQNVTVRISARPVGQVCILITGRFAYRATRPLRPGTYDVKVIHEYPGTGWDTITAGSATVSVP